MVSVRTVEVISFSDLKAGDDVCWEMSDALNLVHHEIVTMVFTSGKFETIGFARNLTQFCTIRANVYDFTELLKEAGGVKVYKVEYRISDPDIRYFEDQEVVERAKLALHGMNDADKNYNLLDNNCEHFATWCKTDRAISFQATNFKSLFLFSPAIALAISCSGPFGLALVGGLASLSASGSLRSISGRSALSSSSLRN